MNTNTRETLIGLQCFGLDLETGVSPDIDVKELEDLVEQFYKDNFYDKCKIDDKFVYKKGSICYIFKQICEQLFTNY